MSVSLQPYLPRLVRYWDEDAPGQLHRRIPGSMLFVDISGFTKMSERLARHGKVGAEEVTEVIDNTFGQLLPAAYTHGANLLKFGGDALLLLFTDAGHERRAAAAALAMRQELRDIGTFATTAGQVSLRMSVGAHSGQFDFFMAGGVHREFIVAGPAASRTVEMESAASAGQILVSPEASSALPRRNQGQAVGPGILLRGQLVADNLEFRAVTTPGVDLAPFIPVALRQILSAGAVEPEHRPTTVAFIHFQGFDQVIINHGVEEAALRLNSLISTIQEVAAKYEVTFLGTDIAESGGKVILTTGVPVTSGHDEEQMLLALREIISADSPLPIRIGVNWGPVFAGEVGPPYRRTYTVMGDTVNLAARLMAKAAVGEIYATAAVLEGSRTTFRVTAPEPFFVKGKKFAIQAHSVGEPEGTKSQQGGDGLPLIGRDDELAELVNNWATVSAGRGRVVEVAAEPGLGKSRLLQEFLAKTRPENLVLAECRLYQATTPYFPFRALLRGLWQLDTDHDAAATGLIELIRSSAPDVEPWASLVGVPLGIHLPESRQVAQIEDQFRPARTITAVGALLAATVVRPTVIVIEDTHWMDEASGELLNGIMTGLEQLPWLIVLSRRTGPGGFQAPETDNVTRLDLAPLGIEQARHLIISAREGARLLPQHVDRLALQAEGSPLFLVELLAAIKRGGSIDELPPSVEGMIAARIDKLPPADRNLLRRVSVLGAGFRLEHTAAVLREEERDAQWQNRAMRRLADFLNVDQSGWVQFRHALIRDVAYGGLPFNTRRSLHARVGDSIRQAAGENADEQAALLSLHYFFAKQWGEAWHYSRMAGDRAKELYANHQATEFYRRALTASRHFEGTNVADRAQVSEALGDVLEQAGLFDESLEAYKRSGRLVGDDPLRRADLLLKRARARARVGSYATAFREISIGCRIVTEVGTREAWQARSRLTALSAQLRQLQEHPRAALKLAQQAKREAEESEEREALARAYQVMDAAYNMLGQPSKAVFGQEALQIYESLGDLPGIATVTNNLGGQAYFEGRWDLALNYYARAQDSFQRAGNEPEAAVSGANIGEVLVSQGRFEEAEEILSESVRVLRAHKLIDAALFAEIQLARLLLSRGDSEAPVRLSRIRAEAAEVGQTHSVVEAGIYLAYGLLRNGHPQAAVALLDETERSSGGEAELFGCSLARVRALTLAALGRVDEAAAVVRKGLAQARDEGLVYEEALLLRTEADLTADADRNKKLEEADRLLQQLGVITSV